MVSCSYLNFNRLYYRHKADQLRVCTLPLHALLHIADDIEAVGPVWCYWAFLMEHFCGALARASKSRLFPFASLNQIVLEVAQLSQIKLIYGLTDLLNLETRCNIATGTWYDGYPDHVFVKPRRCAILHLSLIKRVAEYLGKLVGVETCVVRERLRYWRSVIWGKLQQVSGSTGGDVIRGYSVSSFLNKSTRDATYIKVSLYLVQLGFGLGVQELTNFSLSIYPVMIGGSAQGRERRTG